MTPLDLPSLAAIAKAATPGPWEYRPGIDPPGHVIAPHLGEQGPRPFITAIDRAPTISGWGRECDALHIATFSPDVALALLARIRELEAGLVEACAIAEYRTPSSFEDRPKTYEDNRRITALRALAGEGKP